MASMRTAYLDLFSGIAGDMLVGAFLDAGAPVDPLRQVLAALPLPGVRVDARRETRRSFAGTRFLVEAPQEHHHRRLPDIEGILRATPMPDRARERALDVFVRIARAEARAHGIGEREVHFHEVGAADTIVDIVAACVCVETLRIEQVLCSAVELGSGTVRCEHGVIPVPAPGTLGALLGTRVRIGGLSGERTTPTGAALVAALASSVGEPVEIIPEAVGYGVGSRDPGDMANLLRVVIGEVELEGDRVAVIECNLDDVSGETVGYVIERALAEGALDAFVTPVTMKKGRPAFVVTLLAPLERRAALEALLFRETPTLGVRRHLVSRSKLRREVRTMPTRLGPARVKIRWSGAGTAEVSAEFDDARRLALEHRLPLAQVVSAVEADASHALAHEQGVPHDHGHDHGHGAAPDHGHDQGHGPAHDHGHDHGHGHDHDHGHGHDHGHHGAGHSHGSSEAPHAS